MTKCNTRQPRLGLTLMELVVVLMILVALASVIVMLFPGASSQAQNATTETSLDALKSAVLAYCQDMKGIQVWSTIGSGVPPGATGVPLTLRDLQIKPLDPTGAPVQNYDPLTQRGWRGPYLTSTTGKFMPQSSTATAGLSLDASFYPAAGAGYPSYLTHLYGNAGDIAFLDGWGNPIVLQWPAAGTGDSTNASHDVVVRSQYVRLISAGPVSQNSSGVSANVLDTSPSALMPTKASRGNDLVLFFLTQDLNP